MIDLPWMRLALSLAAMVTGAAIPGVAHAYESRANLTLVATGQPDGDGDITISAKDISDDIDGATAIALELGFTLSPGSCERDRIELLTISLNDPAMLVEDDPVGVVRFTLSYSPAQRVFSISRSARPLVAQKRIEVGSGITTNIKSLDLLPSSGQCIDHTSLYMGTARYKVTLYLNQFNGMINAGLYNKPLSPRVNTPVYFGVGPTLFQAITQRSEPQFEITQSTRFQGSGFDLKLYKVAWKDTDSLNPMDTVEGDLKMRFDAKSFVVKNPTLYLGSNATAVMSTLYSPLSLFP